MSWLGTASYSGGLEPEFLYRCDHDHGRGRGRGHDRGRPRSSGLGNRPEGSGLILSDQKMEVNENVGGSGNACGREYVITEVAAGRTRMP